MKSFRPSVQGRKIRFALVGCGRIAKNHFDSIAKLSDQSELFDFCDTDATALGGCGWLVRRQRAYRRRPDARRPSDLAKGAPMTTPIKLVTGVRARPRYIKSAAGFRALLAWRNSDPVEVPVHAGQQYEKIMSEVFFEELGIGAPSSSLAIASGCHAAITGRMLEAREHVFVDENPDCVLVYGDTNSTLAAVMRLPAKLDAQA